jgi:NADH-quinone oxidoreductase subunit G
MPETTTTPETKQITLTIDGKSVTVPDGVTVLQACEQANSPVPFYCYHPGLSIAGNCRICLVEIEKTPKLQIACYTRAAAGMVVNTTSDTVLKGRQDVLEFLLVNHPLDCPVCDQAGECWLQDYYMNYGLYDQKFDEAKNKKSKKAVPIGPTVMLDQDRCILCSRCVRFTDEISKTGELGIFNRGDHSELDVYPGKQVDNNYSGNIVDICPVGALTDRDFRFKCRVWYLGETNSVCPGCSMGCNIEIHDNRERRDRPHVAGGARVMRLKPRFNADVNQWWMCDVGRYAYASIDQDRITEPRRRDGSAWTTLDWTQALDQLAQWITTARGAKQLDRIGVLLSTHLTNEELFAAKTILAALGLTHVAFQSGPMATGDTILLKADRSPNTAGAKALGLSGEGLALVERAGRKELSGLYVLGVDLVAAFGPAVAERAAKGVEWLAYQGSNLNPTVELATLVLPSCVYAEKDGTFTNVQGRVQRIWAAVELLAQSRPDGTILAELAKRLVVSWGAAGDAAAGATGAAVAEAMFAVLSSLEPAFAGLTYERLGDGGALLTAPTNGHSH